MDLKQIKPVSADQMEPDLRAAEEKCRRDGAKASKEAAIHLEKGRYEEALLSTQVLYASLIKASDAAQLRARYCAPTPCAGNGAEGDGK